MRAAWVLIATAGCRSILGIDTPQHAGDAGDRLADAAADDGAPLDAMPDGLLPDAPPGAARVRPGPLERRAGRGEDRRRVQQAGHRRRSDRRRDRRDLLEQPAAPRPGLARHHLRPRRAADHHRRLHRIDVLRLAAHTGNDTVTVEFGNTTVSDPDVRIAEYPGVTQLAHVDVQTGNTGSSNLASATLTTTSADDLLVAADYGPGLTKGAGMGFDQRVLSSPLADILEDRIAITPGSFTATAPLETTAPWVMQLAAFAP